MNGLFVSSGYLSASDTEALPGFAELPAFLRVLLTTDGTVTKSLESFFWEPVKVETLNQGWHSLTEALPPLEREQGQQVWLRRVRLHGADSGREYARATSHICAEQLEPAMRAQLEAGLVGIGELLRECGLETYRQIIRFGRSSDHIWREYRIVMGHRPFILIREEFPLALYTTA